MRFALRKQQQISESLRRYFADKTSQQVQEDINAVGTVERGGTVYPVLRINDTADSNYQLEFAITGHTWDVLRLALLGRRIQ